MLRRDVRGNELVEEEPGNHQVVYVTLVTGNSINGALRLNRAASLTRRTSGLSSMP